MTRNNHGLETLGYTIVYFAKGCDDRGSSSSELIKVSLTMSKFDAHVYGMHHVAKGLIHLGLFRLMHHYRT
jgi:hypothetical protein